MGENVTERRKTICRRTLRNTHLWYLYHTYCNCILHIFKVRSLFYKRQIFFPFYHLCIAINIVFLLKFAPEKLVKTAVIQTKVQSLYLSLRRFSLDLTKQLVRISAGISCVQRVLTQQRYVPRLVDENVFCFFFN